MPTMKTLRVSSAIGRHVGQGSLAYCDDCQSRKPLGSRMMKVNAVRELQSQSQEELDALLPSVLRPQGGAFKGEL